MAQSYTLFRKMLKGKLSTMKWFKQHNRSERSEHKSKPSILKETRKMSTFPWLNHGSLIQSRSVWTEACAGAEGSARDIAPTLPSLGGKNGIERLVLLPTSVSDLSWCFGSMYKNPYKCYVKRLDLVYILYINITSPSLTYLQYTMYHSTQYEWTEPQKEGHDTS